MPKNTVPFPGTTWLGTSDCGLFATLPLELREKIYAEAVIVRYPRKELHKIEQLESGDCQTPEYMRLAALDAWKEVVAILPGKPNEVLKSI